MTDNVVTFPRPVERCDPYFGRCPVCLKGWSFRMPVGRAEWWVCVEDKTRWCEGENLYSSPEDQSQEGDERNSAFLRTCRAVEPAELPGDHPNVDTDFGRSRGSRYPDDEEDQP
jgi:hypothetical protein